jgi:hypothetical protein
VGRLLIDTQGRAYVDLVNNVTAIGHAHPEFADRISRQLHLLNTNSRFLYDAFAEFTARLVAHSPDPSLDTVIPVNSGSEAVDLALTLARVATGRRNVIAVRESYHGWTSAADAVSTSAFDNPHAADSRPDWVHLVDAPNAYRGRHRGPDAGAAYAREVADLARPGRRGPPGRRLHLRAGAGQRRRRHPSGRVSHRRRRGRPRARRPGDRRRGTGRLRAPGIVVLGEHDAGARARHRLGGEGGG